MKKVRITFDQMCDSTYRRNELMKTKRGAIWQIFFELDGLINMSKFSRIYFKKTQSWFSQRVNGYDVNHKPAEFTVDEYNDVILSLRDLANRLNNYADELKKAE